jgi:hypothetical protein
MKLAKALKLKNKLISEYNDVVIKMQSCNSSDKDAKKNYNAKELLAQAQIQMNQIVNLKTALHNTSAPIRSDIFLLGELKNLLTRINSISTHEGEIKQNTYSGMSIITYVVDINEEEKVQKVKSIQKEIEDIQEKIDEFNATTELVGFE